MEPTDPRGVKPGVNYLDGLPRQPEDSWLEPVRQRLKSGDQYRRGDIFPIFDKEGVFSFASAQAKDAAGNMHLLVSAHASFAGAPKKIYPIETVDRFTRGTRSDLTSLLARLHRQLLDTTMYEMDLVVPISKRGSRPESPMMRLHRELYPSTAAFYHQTPPDYQRLFDVVQLYAEIHSGRLAQHTQITLGEMNTMDDVARARKILLGDDMAQAAEATVTTQLLLTRYAQRLDVATRALLAILDIRIQELEAQAPVGLAVDE